MFCEYCRSMLDAGALLCGTCGREREGAPWRAAAVAVRAPEVELLEGPRCPAHAGMPLLGGCPRCGRQVCVRCAPGAVQDVLTCTDCVGLTRSHQQVAADARCAVHPEARAGFACARCGSFACAACRAAGPGVEGLCVGCVPMVGVLAGRAERFLANLVDKVVLFLPVGAGVVVAAAMGSPGGEQGDGRSELLLVGGIFGGLLVPAILQIGAQLHWGQSLGKRLLGIKVVRMDGSPIELWRLLLLRNIVLGVISQACSVVGIIDALLIFGADKRCLHDLLADTRVIAVPPDASPAPDTAGPGPDLGGSTD